MKAREMMILNQNKMHKRIIYSRVGEEGASREKTDAGENRLEFYTKLRNLNLF